MAKYVGVKLIEATPMGKEKFDALRAGSDIMDGRQITPGYQVVYADGYTSWSPKDVFDRSHICVGEDNTIKEHNINEFILGYDVSQWGDKTTVVHATLANGFIMTEASSCVDPVNFNIDIGERICRERIQNNLWKMLGFLLQTAVNGVKAK